MTDKKRIIVLDDNPAMRTLLDRLLTELGYDVYCANDSKDAFTRAHQHGAPDLVVADLIMPDMDGRDVGRWMRSGYPGAKLLFISGSRPAEFTDALLGKNAAFLGKPFTADQLAEAVLAILAR